MATTSNVEKVKTRRGAKTVGAPGQLDRYDDGSWEFFGNDTTTSEEVAQKIIGYEQAEQNEDYRQLTPRALAQLLLEHADNKKLASAVAGDVHRPIPRSQSFVAEAPTLKKIVAMLLAHEKELRAQLLLQPTATAAEKTLGTVRGGGLDLPYEP